MSYVKMHGPAFDGTGEIVETDVHPGNIVAFELAGWEHGGKPKKEAKAPVETDAAEKPKKAPPKKKGK